MARHDYISGLTSSNAPNERARNIAAILYPESMLDDWPELLASWGLPVAYCIHDKDHLADGELDRKVHVHVYLRAANTTLRYAKKLFETLCDKTKRQSDGSFVTSCCMPVCKINNPREKYDYLIHATERAKKDNKFQYSPLERIEINNFDIGAYEQESQEEKAERVENLVDIIILNRISNMVELRNYLQSVSDPSSEDPDRTMFDTHQALIRGFRAYLGDYMKVNYKSKIEELENKLKKMESKGSY